jgi:hypothetical protein
VVVVLNDGAPVFYYYDSSKIVTYICTMVRLWVNKMLRFFFFSKMCC